MPLSASCTLILLLAYLTEITNIAHLVYKMRALVPLMDLAVTLILTVTGHIYQTKSKQTL